MPTALYMMNTKFNTLYCALNSSQKAAVDTIEGPVMVIAGPGTGKTQILILRIANILRQTQMNPENVLALTFTDAAAYEMRSRLVEIIGNDGYKVPVYTFHGFCNNIIKRNPEAFEDLLSAQDITELEQLRVVKSILEQGVFTHIKPVNQPLFYLKSIVDAIDQLKKEGVSPEQFYRAVEEEKNDFDRIPDKYHEKGLGKGKLKTKYRAKEKKILKNRELAEVYARYEELLRERDEYDFNDMLLKTIESLEKNTDILLQLQEQYQYILVDEHQDTNTSQNRLVELICSFHESPNLFVVGDEKQAIFRFQGASLENFLYFKDRYPGAVLIHLKENYRSSQILLDAATSVFAAGAGERADSVRAEAGLQAVRGYANVPVSIAELDSYYSEYYFIAEEIACRRKQGIPLHDIAVIARRNADLAPMAAALEQYDIPHTIDSDQNILEDREIQKLLFLLRTVAELNNDELVVKLMHFDFLDIYPLDIYRIIDEARIRRVSVWELLEKHADGLVVPLRCPERIAELFGNLIRWNRISHSARLDELFITVINESGFLRVNTAKTTLYDFIGKLTAVYQDIQSHISRSKSYTLQDFLAYMDDLAAHKLQLRSHPAPARVNAVQLMTAHKSKGREFNTVFVINVFDGHWGNARKRGRLFTIPWEYLGSADPSADEDAEDADERRLFYVCLTRAKKEAILTYSRFGLDGREQLPSKYIGEISSELRQNLDVGSFTASFRSRQDLIFQPKKSHTLREMFTENKDILISRLRQQGVSVTALNNYLTCPWRFFFRSLMRIPEVKDAPQLFGTAIHEAINRYLRARQNGAAPGKEFLLQSFQKAMEPQPFQAKDFNLWLERGLNALSGYYDNTMRLWNNPVESELSITGVAITGGLFLKGKIDMVEVVSSANEVVVHDFKTGKPKSRGEIEGTTKNSNGDYKRQLVFYKMLTDGYRNGFYRFKCATVDFVEPNDRGDYKSETFEITPEDIASLKEDVHRLYSDICELAFLDRFCDDQECEYCKLRQNMPL